MLKKLRIKNFKSHRDTTFNFHPRVNVIVGNPQDGKTNVLRAIILLFKNRPSGARYFSNFIEDKKGKTFIEIETDDGHTLSVTKNIIENKQGKRKVSSTEFNLDGEGASNITDRIIDVLNVSDLSIQKQLEVPFLATSSGGKIAKTINKITKLDKADGWIADLTKSINSLKKKIEIYNSDIKSTRGKLKRFKNIDKADELLKKAKRTDSQEKSLKDQIDYLNEIKDEWGLAEEYIVRSSWNINKLKGCIDEAEEVDERIYGITESLYLMEDYIVAFYEIMKFEKKKQRISNVIKFMKKADKLDKDVIKIGADIFSINEYRSGEEQLEGILEEKENLRQEYADIISNEEMCPTCFGDIDKVTIDRILEELN